MTTAENAYLSHLRLPRALAQVGGLFAVVAVVTAAGGLFGVLKHAVGRQRREFGIRTALGASPGQMGRLVFQDGLALVGVGVAGGAAGGWLIAQSLAAFRYGVTAGDPIAWTAVLTTIGLTSLLASWHPARQAMRVDPVTLLREE
jgi:ABC-type antimicrobial peptide transport system permease subunit